MEKERKRWDELVDHFGGENPAYFFFYWASDRQLTEHGGAVPGWLTEKGKTLLADLKEAFEELRALEASVPSPEPL